MKDIQPYNEHHDPVTINYMTIGGKAYDVKEAGGRGSALLVTISQYFDPQVELQFLIGFCLVLIM